MWRQNKQREAEEEQKKKKKENMKTDKQTQHNQKKLSNIIKQITIE